MLALIWQNWPSHLVTITSIIMPASILVIAETEEPQMRAAGQLSAFVMSTMEDIIMPGTDFNKLRGMK